MMASSAQSDPSKPKSLIDSFKLLLNSIALELRTIDVETVLFLLKDRFKPHEQLEEQVRPKEENSGIRLFTCLHDQFLLSENNLDLLIEGLIAAKRQELAERVKKYKAEVKFKSVNCIQLPAEKFVQTSTAMPLVHFIVNIGGKSPFTNDKIQQIRSCIGNCLAIELVDVFFWSVDWLQSGCVYVTYKLHANKDKIMQLQNDALNKKDWLTRLGVQTLQVDQQSPIMIASKDQQVCKQPCRRPCQAVRSVLGNTCPDTTLHSNEMVDIILAIEVPWSVDVHQCKAVAEQCDEAMRNFESNKRISLITYGHHSLRKPSREGLKFEHIALGGEAFQEGSLPITETVVNRGRCASPHPGNSGIADALRSAYGLANSVRSQATKVCILTCFLSNSSSNLEHYRCYHGNDPMKICHLLAECRVSLYIVGIVTNHNEVHILRKENHFLSGITHITGGRYFEINDINRLRPVIEFILKETTSIEKVMGTVNDIVISEINAQYGDVNNVHLAEHLNDQLHKRNVKMEKIKIHHGTPLKPISKLSERVAWANDLDDAIEGLKNMSITHNEVAEVQITQDIQVSHDDPDLEVSSRMVMRQLHRSAYFDE